MIVAYAEMVAAYAEMVVVHTIGNNCAKCEHPWSNNERRVWVRSCKTDFSLLTPMLYQFMNSLLLCTLNKQPLYQI